MKRRGLRLAPLLLLAVGGCVSLDSIAPPVSALAPGNAALCEEGRAIYLGKCTSCHAAEPVSAYPAAQWPGIITDMAPKSKLTPGQERALRAYVTAVLRG